MALAWRERRAAAPPVDVPMLAAAGSWPLLAGALCVYLVLSGPLVLIPQVLTGRGGSVVHAGLPPFALPAGVRAGRRGRRRIRPARCWTGAAARTAGCWLPAAPPR